MIGYQSSNKKWKETYVKDKGNISYITNARLLFFMGIVAFFCVFMFLPQSANAQEEMCPVPEDAGISLFSVLMPCLVEEVQVHGRELIQHMQDFVSPIFSSFLVLVVIIYGVLLIAGMLQKTGRDTFVMLIKVAVVIFVMDNLIYVHDSMYALMDALVQAVTVVGGAGGGIRCPGVVGIWGQLDCIIDMVVGIANPVTLSNGLLGFFVSSFLSGSMGALIGLLGLYFCINLVIGAVKASFIYILAVLALILLIMMGALLVPMIFFKTTFSYFSAWSTMVLSTVLQPMILFAFLSVVIAAMDVIIYTGPNSIYRTIAGEASQAADFNLATFLTDQGIYDEENVAWAVFDQSQAEYCRGQSSEEATGEIGLGSDITIIEDCGEADPTEIRQDGNNWAMGIPIPRITWSRLAQVASGDGGDGGANSEVTGEKLLELATAFIIASLTGFMFVTMLDHIPKIARDLSGGMHNTPALNDTGFEAGAQTLMNQVGSKAGDVAGRLGGLVSGR